MMGRRVRAGGVSSLTLTVFALWVSGCGPGTPVEVVSTEPSDGAVEVGLYQPILAQFSRRLDLASLGAGAVSVDGVAGTVSYDDATQTATFTPDEPLAPSTLFTARVAAGVKDT